MSALRPARRARALLASTLLPLASLSAATDALPQFVAPVRLEGTAGQPFTGRIEAAAGPNTYTATLPPELHLDARSGAIRGTPEYVTHTPVYLFATNAHGTVGRAVSLHVEAPAELWIAPLAMRGMAFVGRPLNAAVLAYGRTGYLAGGVQFTAEGLPPGVSLDGAGRLTGVPTAAGTWTIQVAATAGTAFATRTVTLVIQPSPSEGRARVVAVSADHAGCYQAGVPCGLTLQFSTPVLAFGTPRLAVHVGPVVRYATLDAGAPEGAAASTDLHFTVAFDPADAAPDGVALDPQIDVTDGAIVDAHGQPVGLSVNRPDLENVTVAPLPPPVPVITALTTADDLMTVTGRGEGVVAVYRDGELVGETPVRTDGSWAMAVPTEGSSGRHEFSARTRLPGAAIYSEASAAVSTFAGQTAARVHHAVAQR